MKIITGFRHPQTQVWNQWCDNLKKSAEQFGHDVIVLDISCDDWIAKDQHLYLSLCWKYKLRAMKEALQWIDDDLVWIDADCLVVAPIRNALDGMDVALTLRNHEDRYASNEPLRDGYINSGVVFLKRNNTRTMLFLDDAIAELDKSLYDQEAINRVLKSTGHELVINEVVGKSYHIKLLDCRRYNNFYFDQTEKGACILHFKGERGRPIYEEYLRNLSIK